MNQETSNLLQQQGPTGHVKLYTIYVNSRPKQIPAKELLSFDEIVILAFGSVEQNPNIVYTVTYRRGEGNKPEGTLVQGESVKPKEGMIFDVTRTDRS
jgi:hypothetical protein